MVDQFIRALERPISRVRLQNYRSPGGRDIDMVVHYFHNLELSEALYPSLQAFEIALRNSVHASLSVRFQTEFWFDTPDFLPSRQANQVAEVKKALGKARKPPTADRIVAELHLGFWHSLFNSPFEIAYWRPQKAFLLGEVFPNIDKRSRNRQAVWDRIDLIRIIRNRVMHFEPVWSRPQLAQDHSAILEALRWMSVDMYEPIAMCDRFGDVLVNGEHDVLQRIQMEIQRRFPVQ